jgi:lipopolysaccharide cholinephosphotransferase
MKIDVLSNDQLIKLQEKESLILAEFDRVCELLGLTYWISDGTLLGAIRHKNFIPWDDDVDVEMPLNDFLILSEKWTTVANPDFFFQFFTTDNGFLSNYAKIRMQNTSFIEYSSSRLSCNQGIFIDIFPLFHLPRSKFKQKLCDYKLKSLYERIYRRYLKSLDENQSFLRKAKSVLNGFFTFWCSPEKATIRLWKYELSVDRKNKNSGLLGPFQDPLIVFNESWFNTKFKTPFGRLMVFAPSGYKNILEAQYGDYMELPPIDKRCSHHELIVLSFDSSVKND